MKALSNTELISFCSRLALILRSGISSLEGLSLMAEDLPEGDGRQILETVSAELENTGYLYLALQAAEVFPPYMCSMTEIGEQTGRLDNVMEALAEHYRKEETLSKNIKSAVTYPLVMIGIMLVVIGVLILEVMPVFQQVFELLGAEMTGVSEVVLGLGNSLRDHAAVFLVLILSAAAIGSYAAFTRNGRRMARSFSFRFFATKRISERLACSHFANGMHLCLSSGLDIDQSLEMTEQLVEHPVVRARISELRRITAEGGSFAEAAADTRLFSGIAARMLSIGFRTGATAEVMKQISDRYNEETEERINSIIEKLEPTLVAVLSIAAGMILLSVMLPLMGIMSNIG